MKIKRRHSFFKKTIYAVVAVTAVLVPMLSFSSFQSVKTVRLSKTDSLASQKAFLKVYAVLMSPRCMNCHPSGDVPLQGEDSHLHLQGVKRGPDGKGMYALKCANCHQLKNIPGLNMPPGNPNWRLPPANMRMVFQGRTPRALAKQLMDRKQNGNKSVPDLIKHVTGDSLVLSGWTPAQGLARPPLSHTDFVAAFNEWIKKGAIAPSN